MKNILGLLCFCIVIISSCSSNLYLGATKLEKNSDQTSIYSYKNYVRIDSLQINSKKDKFLFSENRKYGIISRYDSLKDIYQIQLVNGTLCVLRKMKFKIYPPLLLLNNGAIIYYKCFGEICIPSIIGTLNKFKKETILDTINSSGIKTCDFNKKNVLISYTIGPENLPEQKIYIINKRGKNKSIFSNKKACNAEINCIKVSKKISMITFFKRIDLSISINTLNNCKLDTVFINSKKKRNDVFIL